MSFLDTYNSYYKINLNKRSQSVSNSNIKQILLKDYCSVDDFMDLLSPCAQDHLEAMAEKAKKITLQYFGKTIQLYTPLYLSNYCNNICTYCGFNAENKSQRKKLSIEQVKKEAKAIADTGLKHILILTGDSPKDSPVDYIRECVGVLKQYFSSISIETYALTKGEYAQLIKAGVDGITIYQEVYDQNIYDTVHVKGPKKDYNFRLDAAQRALAAGIRTANIGALLGLACWPKEVLMTGLHAKYLQDNFSDAEIGLSVPRLRPHLGAFKDIHKVTDKDLVQIILALRIFLPRVGITLSTRENQHLRDNLLGLGITRISAGSTTAVGGHTQEYQKTKDEQFEISDCRDVKQITRMLKEKKYQPVLKDWMSI